jgi:DNA modification methylase
LKQNESNFVVFDIKNPKIKDSSASAKESTIFPYYAGYASSFAEHTLSAMRLPVNSLVVDPWNGSGTTTIAAAALGVRAVGFDLNPVMVMAAKAALLITGNEKNMREIADEVINHSRSLDIALAEEPLEIWLFPSAARVIRAIETTINTKFVGSGIYLSLLNSDLIDKVPSLAAFLYICLFRSVRKLLLDFVPTNPTWVKQPLSKKNRKRPTREAIEQGFLREICQLGDCLPMDGFPKTKPNDIDIKLGDAKQLPIPGRSVDVILTSPPYCTRIDYAVATSIELAVLRCSRNDFSRIRRSLMGNSTVEKTLPTPMLDWGATCLTFLDQLYNHPSQASKTYYYKTHVQYFSSLRSSINEVARVLKVGGHGIFVVQDSHYKEIHNDIPQITVDMATAAGLVLVNRKDFLKNNSMSVINARAKKYLSKRQNAEAVLVFALM